MLEGPDLSVVRPAELSQKRSLTSFKSTKGKTTECGSVTSRDLFRVRIYFFGYFHLVVNNSESR